MNRITTEPRRSPRAETRLLTVGSTAAAITLGLVALSSTAASSTPSNSDGADAVLQDESDVNIIIRSFYGSYDVDVPYQLEPLNLGPDRLESGTIEIEFNRPITGVTSPDGCTFDAGVVSCPIGASDPFEEDVVDFTVSVADVFFGGTLEATATLVTSMPTDPNSINNVDVAWCEARGGTYVVC